MDETLSELVRRVDEDRWLAAQFAEPAGRARLMALYAVTYEIARTPETVREVQLGAIRLQWWREGISAALAGAPAIGHPILQALARAHGEAPLSEALFDQMIDARLSDLVQRPFADWAALETYVDATAGATCALAAQTLRAPSQAAVAVGRAWGLCGLWRATDFHRARGRVILPPGASLDDLAARATERFQALAGLRCESSAAPALIYAALCGGYLKGRALGALGKRWRLVSAAFRGRLAG